MRDDYKAWIEAFAAARKGYLRGACMTATAEMVAAFPELTRVPGFCNTAEHFWCVTPEGEIVDPTAAQFGTESLHYEAFKPGDEVKVGRCMDCGADIYEHIEALGGEERRRYFCNDECRLAFGAYLDAEEEARERAREEEDVRYEWDNYDPADYYDDRDEYYED